MMAPVFDRVGLTDEAEGRGGVGSNPHADFIGPLLAGAVVRETLASAAWGDLVTAPQQVMGSLTDRSSAARPHPRPLPEGEGVNCPKGPFLEIPSPPGRGLG
jgi:hypothetical protein